MINFAYFCIYLNLLSHPQFCFPCVYLATTKNQCNTRAVQWRVELIFFLIPFLSPLCLLVLCGSAVLLAAAGYFVRACLLRRQKHQKKDEIEHAILKQLPMPTLEELEGELPDADPFADGADNTEGMVIRERLDFLEVLGKRRKKWKDVRLINFDRNEILEEDKINSRVGGRDMNLCSGAGAWA